MTSLFESVRDRAMKRTRYTRTIAELKAASVDTRLDLDIDESDIPMIAKRAVYGS